MNYQRYSWASYNERERLKNDMQQKEEIFITEKKSSIGYAGARWKMPLRNCALA
jgi:hypothetical protein